MMLFILTEVVGWGQILLQIFGPAGVITVLIFLLKWKRFGGLDKSERNKRDAEATKILADAAKGTAEAKETLIKADISIAAEAMKLAERISTELAGVKVELAQERVNLQDTQDELQVAREALIRADIRVKQLQSEMNEKDKRIAMMTKENDQLKQTIKDIQSHQ